MLIFQGVSQNIKIKHTHHPTHTPCEVLSSTFQRIQPHSSFWLTLTCQQIGFSWFQNTWLCSFCNTLLAFLKNSNLKLLCWGTSWRSCCRCFTLKIWGLRRAARFTALTYKWSMQNTWKQVKKYWFQNWRRGCGRLSRRFTAPWSWDHPSLSHEPRVTCLMKLHLDPGRSGDCSDWVVPLGWFLWLGDIARTCMKWQCMEVTLSQVTLQASWSKPCSHLHWHTTRIHDVFASISHHITSNFERSGTKFRSMAKSVSTVYSHEMRCTWGRGGWTKAGLKWELLRSQDPESAEGSRIIFLTQVFSANPSHVQKTRTEGEIVRRRTRGSDDEDEDENRDDDEEKDDDANDEETAKDEADDDGEDDEDEEPRETSFPCWSWYWYWCWWKGGWWARKRGGGWGW